jgi:hypothetical protein
VAPAYRNFPLALRLKNGTGSRVFLTAADIRRWLPGDNLYDDAIFVPADMPSGEYDLDLALVDVETRTPKVKLAIAGIGADGWYRMGKIRIVERSAPIKP